MSGRFVRASKYRHVHGVAARKDKCYLSTRASFSGDSNYITANSKYLAFPAPGGGGPVVVHKRANITRLSTNPPKINVHKSKVLDVQFNPFIDNVLATGADDGTIAISIIPEEEKNFNTVKAAATLIGHQKKISFVNFNPVASNVLASSSHDQTVKIWDVEKQTNVLTFTGHTDQIQSFAWNEGGNLISTTCKDKLVRLYDPRVEGKVSQSQNFEGGKPSKVVWLNKGRLVTVGFNKRSVRQYSIWDSRKMDKHMATKDIDQAAGVLFPFFDPDNSILYLAGKGDGNIRYFEIVDEAPYAHYLSEFQSNEAQKGVCWVPKRALNVKECEIALALRLMRDYIQIVSFKVPRKSELFQEDIYPDTYAGVPSASADEWLKGKNPKPIKRSMKPGASTGSSSQATFVAQKSPVQLKKELEEALAKIKKLEARVKELEGK